MCQTLHGQRPQLCRQRVLQLMAPFDVNRYTVKLFGIRGYFERFKEDNSKSYDDAIFVISPDKFLSFNADTNPARMEPGGPYNYIYRRHHPEGFVQISNATYPSADPWHGDDFTFSKGDFKDTMGRQKIHPAQWVEFMRLVKHESNKYSQKIIPYVLINAD